MDNICKNLDLLKYEKDHSVYKFFDVRDYVKTFTIGSEEVCNNIKVKLDNADWQSHYYYDPSTDKKIVLDHDYSVFNLPETDPDVEVLMSNTWSALRTYYDSLQYHEWFSTWTGYTHIRFNRCAENNKIMRHYDGVQTLSDGLVRREPILSIVGRINNDYEGGELIMWEDTLIDLEPGQIIIFPSNFMFPHQVNTVTKGNRYSFVSWAY